ncbi:hypothetical protein CSV75_02745 [Sporosarcina sp. P18a]|nr:hypothetical protein CSV81_06815 [Sporosarcina sp. P10]PIC61366.1 hypothetical protein CSV80_06670 [Sporosarcina sp. P12(2017)]PIC80724.1 hypothetical protein CSV75_02745 [Sporosarcina sp. P18a]PID04211.1 hypothetical protein CSV67_01700 [Sporosarcina sp. P2]
MSVRSFRTYYIIISTLLFSTVLFPIFTFGNKAYPLILGLPYSFFWIILWIVITFIAVLILYFIDPDKEEV